MPNLPQRNFASGELAPALYARTDLARYQSGLRTCRNFFIGRHGGAYNRPGTEYVGLSPNGVPALRAFVFNDDQAYVLEFSHTVIKFVRDGAYIGGGTGYTVSTPWINVEVATVQLVQSADVVTITHPNHPPYELRRIADDDWTLTLKPVGVTIDAPTGLVTNIIPAPTGTDISWVVTALSSTSSEESLPSAPVSLGLAELPSGVILYWTAVDGAAGYNVYKSTSDGGGYGFVGTSTTPSFSDIRLTPDFDSQPPTDPGVFDAVDHYPGVVGMDQQRMLFGASTDSPETIWASRVGVYDNFSMSTPLQDDDAVTFTLAGRTVNVIRHLVGGARLLALTSGGEWVIRGDQSGVLRPTDINAKQFSSHGSSVLPPIAVAELLLYVQARQSIIRAINVSGDGASDGPDLTLFSSHLFDGYTITDWAFQEVPTPILWVVRSDGVLLGCTIIPDQQMLAWHRHDTDGVVQGVCVIPEDGEDRLYLVVLRGEVRMMERMASRSFTDIDDALFADCALTYDGRNTDDTLTITLSGGSTWTYDELLTLTASAAHFAFDDAGDEIVFTADDGSLVHVRINAVTSDVLATGYATADVPAELQGIASADWSHAIVEVGGLAHLEGYDVAIVGDGYVVASPNNPAFDTVTVAGAKVTLSQPYSRIAVGLPYLSDFETLDIDSPGGASIKDKKILVNGALLMLERSRGAFVGPSLSDDDDPIANMDEMKLRTTDDGYGPIALRTGDIDVVMPSEWSRAGRMAVRNIDPLPLTISAVIPRGTLG